MHPNDEAIRLAREKVQQAERALAAFEEGTESKSERLNELARAVVVARRELLKLHTGPRPEME